MKADRPLTSQNKECNYLNVTDDDGNVYAVSLKLTGTGHAITKKMKDFRSTLLDKLAETINETLVSKAKALFHAIDDADGAGIVVDNLDLLAEDVAERFDVKPAEVYAEYGGDEGDAGE